MFLGQYNHTMDTKGRCSLPARFREDLTETFIMTKGLDSCLFIYDLEEWGRMDQKIRSQLSLFSKAGRDFARQFYAGAMEVSCDRQGRVLIPPHLRAFAGLKKEIVVLGVSDRIEIWSKEEWEDHISGEAMNYDSLIDELQKAGIVL